MFRRARKCGQGCAAGPAAFPGRATEMPPTGSSARRASERSPVAARIVPSLVSPGTLRPCRRADIRSQTPGCRLLAQQNLRVGPPTKIEANLAVPVHILDDVLITALTAAVAQ